MYLERIAAKGFAAVLVSILLLILPPAIIADETYGATLVAVENIDSGPYSHRVSVRIGNRTEHLLLNKNLHLNQLRIVNGKGETLKQSGIAYTGIVEFLPNSWARLTIDGDFIAGTISTDGQRQHISSELLQKNSTNGLYTQADNKSLDKTLLPPTQAKRQTLELGRLLEPSFEEINVTPLNRPFTDSEGSVTRVANIGVVIDSLYNEATAGRGVSIAIGIINSVDGLYRETFGLALKVDVVVLINDESTLTLDGDNLEANLELFKTYRIESELLPAELGLVHLFTGAAAKNDDTKGLAFRGTTCRTDGYDVSMSRPFEFSVILAAHEIGHNLDAQHDDETTACADINDHLMFSEISTTTTQAFSSCSIATINTRLEQSTCFAQAIDIGLQVTKLESNQILATVTNNDSARAFPSATLEIDLTNTAVAEAPAICELESPEKLICTIPATYAGATQQVAVKLRGDPYDQRTIAASLTPVGFFDLSNSNDKYELVLPAEARPIVVVEANEATTTTGGSGGGGSFDRYLVWLLLSSCFYRQYSTDALARRSINPA